MSHYRHTTLSPVYSDETRVMVLGSFPGRESLRKGQYYAHPRNLFWKVMGDCLGEDLSVYPYDRRIERLLSRGVGLWDVYGGCAREGSLDSSIRDATPNDLSFLETLPSLELVVFNGKKAGSAAMGLSLATEVLPSTSPANTRYTYSQKRRIWCEAIADHLIPDRLSREGARKR